MNGASGVALAEIVQALGGELVGDPERLDRIRIDRLGPIADATPSTLTFLANARLAPELARTQAGCVIVAPALQEAAAARGAAILADDPYLYHARLSQWWVARSRSRVPAGVHPTAVVDPLAQIDSSASVGPLAVIEAGAVIGADAVVGAQCFVGAGARVGAGTRLAARVTLHGRCSIGARGIVHSGVVIGADGFGFAPTEGRWEKIEQLGAVRIGDDVEIGANTCIDRGALDDTVIGDGVKFDNLVQIGHNTRVGEHSVLAGCAGVAGSTTIGRGVMIGGAAMISGHLEIAEGVTISGGSTVTHSVLHAGTYTSVFPLDEHAAWEKNAAVIRHLFALRGRVKALERAVAQAPPPAPARSTTGPDETTSAA